MMRPEAMGFAWLYLERDLRPFWRARKVAVPKRGWLREIRQVYEVPVHKVAWRLGVKERMVYQLERSEQKGSITLQRLKEAAAALDCDLVYAVVPRSRAEFSRAVEIADRQNLNRIVERFRR